MPRPCKICKLKKTNKKAYKKITDQIKGDSGISMAKFIKKFNDEFDLDIIPMNASRHKTHMEGNVHELTERNKANDDKNKQNQTPQGNAFLSQSSNKASFPALKPKHEKWLLAYRANGWTSKEEAAKKVGIKDTKMVYAIERRPEVQAAIYELKAIDFINLRITGNQIIAGIGKIARHNEHLHEMYNDKGELITDIRKWPEALRIALKEVKQEATIINIGQGEDAEEAVNVKYAFKFESALAAEKELRKHFMDVDLYKKGEEKRVIHEKTVAIQEMRREKNLSLIETMKIFEDEGLPFPESLKLEIKDFDWELEKRIKKAETNAKKALTLVNGSVE